MKKIVLGKTDDKLIEKISTIQDGKRRFLGTINRKNQKKIEADLINMLKRFCVENCQIEEFYILEKRFVFKDLKLKNKIISLTKNKKQQETIKNNLYSISFYFQEVDQEIIVTISELIKYKALTYFKNYLLNNFFAIV